MTPFLLGRGDLVEVRVFGGSVQSRRVWSTDGDGVQVCSESEWQRHLATGAEPLWAGWPVVDVLAARLDETTPVTK